MLSAISAADTVHRGELSGLTDLPGWLRRFREIGALTDEAEALAQCDLLLWTAIEMHEAGPVGEKDWDDLLVTEQLERVGAIGARLRLALEKYPGDVRVHDAELLRREAEAIGLHATRQAREAHAQAIIQARAESAEVVRTVEIACHARAVRQAGAVPILNAGTVAKVLASVDTALAALEEREALTPELLKQGREAKVRAARWRAERRLEEASVADAGGNGKRASRLRAEAREYLRLDWLRAFPGEAPPEG